MICPICLNTTNLNKSYLPKFMECSQCSGHFASKSKGFNYKKEYFFEDGKSSFISKFAKPLLLYFYECRYDAIKPYIRKNAKILDYGAGKGQFVELLINKKLNAEGYEPSLAAVKLALSKNIPLSKTIKNKRYDIITCWHSLEHSSSPGKDVKRLKKNLIENGKILIAVPNADSWESRIAKSKWFHYSYPLHQIAFTPKSLTTMLERSGFKVTSMDYFTPEYTISGLIQTYLNYILPKDVFYSIVSERRGQISFNKAIFISFLSIVLIIVASPLLFLFYFLELIFSKTGAMVVVASYEEK